MKKMILMLSLSMFTIVGGYIITKPNVVEESTQKNEYRNNSVTNSIANTNTMQNTIMEIASDETIIKEENILIENNDIEIEPVIEENFSNEAVEKVSKEIYANEEIKENEEPTIIAEETFIEIEDEIVTELNIDNHTEETQVIEEIKDTQELQNSNKEEYRYNSEMTQKIVQIINNNPSEMMVQNGFSTIEDKSIIELTNQFTFSEKRVKAKIKNLFGTIRVYAQDYYLNDSYIATECYIF